jgi:hypothetical protein
MLTNLRIGRESESAHRETDLGDDSPSDKWLVCVSPGHALKPAFMGMHREIDPSGGPQMPQQTKAQRSEAARKGAATRQANKANHAGDDAKKAAKRAVKTAGDSIHAAGRAAKAAGKAASGRAKR